MTVDENILKGKKHLHFIGIGGSGMFPMVQILHNEGFYITGSDNNETETTKIERKMGIEVIFGQKAENIEGADLVVHTAAIMADNPELIAAKASGMPVIERSVLLGLITSRYSNAVCVCGTHGKTTTTSMVTHILMEAQWDPTVMIGGYLPLLHAGHRVGEGDTIVLESCEYCDSFLNFNPTLAIILNVEADHLDYFEDLKAIQKSFRKFAQLSTNGILANGDDPHTVEALEGLDYVTFGFGQQNRVHADNVCADWRHLDVICDGEFYCHLDLEVLGKHNATNALAAAGAAWMLGVPGEFAANGLHTFRGAQRRLEYKGQFGGADIYDDYAHHPDELAATIEAIRTMGYERVMVAFQPHTFSRTHALFDDFVRELRKPDQLVLAEIYAARERNLLGISSMDLVRELPGSIYCATLPDVTAKLKELAQPGDVILTVGAGDIYRAGEALLK